jgi:hypothetical protein
MPKVQKVFTLDVNPNTYLRACSTEELVELQLLMSKPEFQNKINKALNPNSTK